MSEALVNGGAQERGRAMSNRMTKSVSDINQYSLTRRQNIDVRMETHLEADNESHSRSTSLHVRSCEGRNDTTRTLRSVSALHSFIVVSVCNDDVVTTRIHGAMSACAPQNDSWTVSASIGICLLAMRKTKESCHWTALAGATV